MDTLPLHQDLLKKVGKEVLTGEACDATEVDNGKWDKRFPRWWKHFSSVPQLHEREGNMRQRSEHLAGVTPGFNVKPNAHNIYT
jgi:hypothetical protein